jgi:hypothetical protein
MSKCEHDFNYPSGVCRHCGKQESKSHNYDELLKEADTEANSLTFGSSSPWPSVSCRNRLKLRRSLRLIAFSFLLPGGILFLSI